MVSMNDTALLQAYARTGDESAFAALVERHLALVHSAARRQVRDLQLAEDITQAVFVVLARKASSLARHPGLSGWLLQATRYAANNHIRAAVRRAHREQEAVMQSESIGSSAAPWDQLEPLLDEGMSSLGETDRAVLAMRYFENKTAAEIGQALNLNEETARKRINRALDKLRRFFGRRGVAVTAASIAEAASAYAVQTAPVGLAAAITAKALSGTALTTAAVLAASKTIAMTTLKKALVSLALIASVGAGIYEARENAQLRDQNQSLESAQTPFIAQIRQLQAERDAATNQLVALAREIERGKSNQLELLRLRALAGVARHATAEAEQLRAQLTQAQRGNGTNLFAGAMVDAMRLASEQQVRGRLDRLSASLRLRPDQVLAVSNILMRQANIQSLGVQQVFSGDFDQAQLKQQAVAAGDPEAQIKALLAPDQLAAYPACQRDEAAHTASQAANAELVQLQTSLDLTPDQLDPVYAALYTMTLDQLTGTVKPPPDIKTMSDVMVWPMERKTEALASLLTPTQLETYRQQQAAQVQLMKNIAYKLDPVGTK